MMSLNDRKKEQAERARDEMGRQETLKAIKELAFATGAITDWQAALCANGVISPLLSTELQNALLHSDDSDVASTAVSATNGSTATFRLLN